MSARAPRILMVGTAPQGRGRVAALVALRAGGLFEQASVRYMSTHREGGFLTRLCDVVSGWAAFVRSFAPRARVTVVANAVPLPRRLDQRAKPGRIFFLGRVEAAKGVAELLDAAAILAPRFPAVVATAVGAIPEALREGENGLLVPPRDGAALVSALAWVPDDAILRPRLGEQARRTVAQHYSTEAVCGRLAATYNDMAGAR